MTGTVGPARRKSSNSTYLSKGALLTLKGWPVPTQRRRCHRPRNRSQGRLCRGPGNDSAQRRPPRASQVALSGSSDPKSVVSLGLVFEGGRGRCSTPFEVLRRVRFEKGIGKRFPDLQVRQGRFARIPAVETPRIPRTLYRLVWMSFNVGRMLRERPSAALSDTADMQAHRRVSLLEKRHCFVIDRCGARNALEHAAFAVFAKCQSSGSIASLAAGH